MRPKTKLIVAKPWAFIPARHLSPFADATPGLYYRVELCITQAECPKCGAEVGEPCKGKLRAYSTRACDERRAAANEDRIPRSVHLARVEVHFNDLEPWYGRDATGQHESIKICWPVREKTVAQLEKERKAWLVEREKAEEREKELVEKMEKQQEHYERLLGDSK